MPSPPAQTQSAPIENFLATVLTGSHTLFWLHAVLSLQFSHVHSFSCRDRLRNWQANCFIVGLTCVTITWQQIFKGSPQIMVKSILPHATVERRHLGKSCSKTVTADSGIARNFILCEKEHGLICSNASTNLKIHC